MVRVIYMRWGNTKYIYIHIYIYMYIYTLKITTLKNEVRDFDYMVDISASSILLYSLSTTIISVFAMVN
jgi:hypothetical protein